MMPKADPGGPVHGICRRPCFAGQLLEIGFGNPDAQDGAKGNDK